MFFSGLPKMKCPSCGYEFPRFASLRLSPFTVIRCSDCEAALQRVNKIIPLLLAVGGICAFGYMLTTIEMSTANKIISLFAIIYVAVVIDEGTAKLQKLDD